MCEIKAIIRATATQRRTMTWDAMAYAEAHGLAFSGLFPGDKVSTYCAAFTDSDGEWFNGWFLKNNDGDIDIAFGSGQMVFNGDIVLTDEDYYETLGAGL